jgi:hypothetical protein
MNLAEAVDKEMSARSSVQAQSGSLFFLLLLSLHFSFLLFDSGLCSASVTYDANTHKIVLVMQGKKIEIQPSALRRACQCAGCVDEKTGSVPCFACLCLSILILSSPFPGIPKLNPDKIPSSIRPIGMQTRGLLSPFMPFPFNPY